MTKADRVGTVLRKFDYLWQKRSMTFCQVVKEITKGNLELTDEEITEAIKDIDTGTKQEK